MRGTSSKASLLLLVVLTLVGLAGCGDPSGTDGNLMNGWQAMPAATVRVPVAHSCYESDDPDLSEVVQWPAVVPCNATHNVELIYVGQFTGAAAGSGSLPTAGSADLATAYQSCADQAKTFLGGDWRTGNLALNLDLPAGPEWAAGGRYYRCDLQQFRDLQTYQVVDRTTSLTGALTDPASAVRIGCVTIAAGSDSSIKSMLPASCTASHNGEFAGVWNAPAGAFQTNVDTRRTTNLTGCRTVTSAYAGVPNDDKFGFRTGQIATPFSQVAWGLGNRGVRCYLWLSKNFTSSVHSAGSNGLPINYG